MDIFRGIFQYFFGTAISSNRSKWALVEGLLCLVSQIIIILVGFRKGYGRNIIGQIQLLFWEQWKNLIKTWKTEAFEQNYLRKSFCNAFHKNSLKWTFDEVLSYLSHSLGHSWKKLHHHKCFFTTFVKFFKIAILQNAGEQLLLKE